MTVHSAAMTLCGIIHDCLSIFLLGEIFTATVYFFIATVSEKNY